MAACSVLPPLTQEKEKRMRRKRFQRGCLKTRKRNGKNYWYAQWREDGKPKSKEIGLCSKMDRMKAEGILTEILKPINEGAENPVSGVNYFFSGQDHVDVRKVLRGRLPS